MAKGGKQPGAGRPKGTANKSTTLAREAIAGFVDGNVDRLVGWLDRIADDSPKDAFNCFMSVVEYHIPKLARSEFVGDKKNPIELHGTLDLKSEVLKAIPQEELDKIISRNNA